MNKKCKLLICGGASLALLIVVEITLRLVWGFGKMPLYASSDKYEYMALPNQCGVRLGNRYYYNVFGMRSDEVNPHKKHILGLGDSVIYGGVQTDQDSLATSLFSVETGMQMLNISGGSWGPDNCAAYLKEKGMFNAKGIFLLVSSHDAHDNMDFTPVVGVHPSYPDKQYFCAMAEVLCRYIYPRYIQPLFDKGNKELDPDQKVLAGVGIHKNGKVFNPGFDQLKAMADSAKIPFVVYLHAEQEENAAKKYNEQGDEIIAWCKKNQVRLLEDLHLLTKDDYRDGIHINNSGQRKLANVMEQEFARKLE